MKADMPIRCDEEAIVQLIEYCQSRGLDRFLLIADDNTYAALGGSVEASLRARDWDVRTVILNGAEVLADEARILDVLLRADGKACTYLAVGSGTITDITRYTSYCSRNPFIALPTAPSVDAYASGGAALVLGGFKLTVPAQAPLAIFADLTTLCEAPREMIAAGFGDMLGKYTSLADWRLGALLLDEAYDAGIAARAERALLSCVAHTAEIGQASANGIRILMDGLFESGLCMMAFGSSRPASGSEHLLSHFLEIKRVGERRPAMLHGTQVAVGTVLAARRYAVIRGLTRQNVIDRLSFATLPSPEEEIQRIRRVYGPVAEGIIANHRPFLDLLEARFDRLKERILDHWQEVQAITANVPPPTQIAALLAQVGGVSDPAALGLGEEDVTQALENMRYLRPRFNVYTLCQVLTLS